METAQIHVEIDDISRLMSLNLHYEALPLKACPQFTIVCDCVFLNAFLVSTYTNVRDYL